jgi:hypothetical protein
MRIRTIKPEFWTHPVMTRQSDATKLLAVGLLNYADDEGYFYAEPRMVRAALRPFDEDSTIVRRGLDDLSNIGFVSVREHSSHGLIGLVLSFKKHQRVDRPAPSKIRCFYEQTQTQAIEQAMVKPFGDDSSNTQRALVANVALEQGTGNREQGNKGKDIGTGRKPVQKASKSASPSRPKDEDEAAGYFVAQGSTDEQGRTFFDHFKANGWKQGGRTALEDWRAAARNWIRRAIQNQAEGAIRSGMASRGAAAGLGGGVANRKNNFGAAGGAARTEEFVKLPIVGIDIGADEVAALEAGKGGAA